MLHFIMHAGRQGLWALTEMFTLQSLSQAVIDTSRVISKNLAWCLYKPPVPLPEDPLTVDD